MFSLRPFESHPYKKTRLTPDGISLVLVDLVGKLPDFPVLLDFRQSLQTFFRLAARRAENLSPKGFLFALSNPTHIKNKAHT